MSCDCEDEHGPVWGGTIRWIPRHYWWRVFVGRVRHPGHAWLYGGLIRRDTFTVGGWGVVVMRMPHRVANAATSE
jgi:hypothetical protein